MINDHTLCYGHPWHPICKKCARNITDRISAIDDSVFSIIPSAPLDIRKKECLHFTKKLFYKKRK